MPLYELFFELEVSICDRFPATTPFSIRREPAREVFLLTSRMNRKTARDNKKAKAKNGPKVIRRPAGDDWF